MKRSIFLFTLLALTALVSFNFTKEADRGNELQFEEMEVAYYESMEDFLPAVNQAIAGMVTAASETEEPHGFTISRNADGYSMSTTVNLSGQDIDPGDIERCDCSPGMGEGELNALLDGEPCWWMIAFSNHVWGWDGC